MTTFRILRSRRGAILNILDVVVVAGILAFAVVIAIPGYQREAHRERAREVKRDLQAIESAVNAAAEKLDLEPGQPVTFEDYRPYLKRKPLKATGKNAFGNSYPEQKAGERPRLSRETHARFASVVHDSFWGDFLPRNETPAMEQDPAAAPGEGEAGAGENEETGEDSDTPEPGGKATETKGTEAKDE